MQQGQEEEIEKLTEKHAAKKKAIEEAGELFAEQLKKVWFASGLLYLWALFGFC